MNAPPPPFSPEAETPLCTGILSLEYGRDTKGREGGRQYLRELVAEAIPGALERGGGGACGEVSLHENDTHGLHCRFGMYRMGFARATTILNHLRWDVTHTLARAGRITPEVEVAVSYEVEVNLPDPLPGGRA